jgi:glycopeptide antibiotics resistance protein
MVVGSLLFNRSMYHDRVFELNPLAFISYFGEGNGSLKNLLNIATFIPFGVLFHGVPLKKLIPFSLLGIFLIEATQYFTYRGVFDLSDVLLNFSGIYFGMYVGKYFAQKGVKLGGSSISSTTHVAQPQDPRRE